MSITENHPFYVPFYTIKINNWLDKKIKLLNLVDWSDKSCLTNEHFTDYHKYKKGNAPYFSAFFDIIKDDLKGFNNLEVRTLWAQRYNEQQHMNVHTHGVLGFSAVLYAEFDKKEHKATTFYAPFPNFIDGTCMNYTPQVEEGDLLMFPSALMHAATPNISTKQRTIFSFNANFI